MQIKSLRLPVIVCHLFCSYLRKNEKKRLIWKCFFAKIGDYVLLK